MSDGHTSIDELLDRAVSAINRGDRVTATELAEQVLAVDVRNSESEDLLTAPATDGEIRRLTILFADLVDSTVLSTRTEPETYRLLVGRYRELVLAAVRRFDGNIASTKGDGLLAVFGHPAPHEDDIRRAVLAGLEITREVAKLSDQAQRKFGLGVDVRVGIHRGLVYLDTEQDDVYGLAANLAARVSGLAPPGTVVVSDSVAPLVQTAFELQARPAASVKGIAEPIVHHRVLGERAALARGPLGPLVGRDRELNELALAWNRARAGELAVPALVFRGEPGIGKSRLASAAAELAQQSGGVVLELTGSPFHTEAGLYPVRTLLERRCGIGRNNSATERLELLETEVRSRSLESARIVPLLAPVLGISGESGYEPVAAGGQRLYELVGAAVQSYLLACLDGGAGLVVADDVHWFDPSTIDVLGTLQDVGAGRLLVVVTGRPGHWLPVGWPATVCDLTPLTAEQADELIAALDSNLSAEERAAVCARCDGVPFYLEHVVSGLGGVDDHTVPEALYEPLFSRLQARANAVPVLEAAAIIGRDVDRALLCSVCKLSDDDIDRIVADLLDARVLEPWGADGLRFRHELLREVALEVAPPSVRRELHARVADALAATVRNDASWPEPTAGSTTWASRKARSFGLTLCSSEAGCALRLAACRKRRDSSPTSWN